jgi:hypothetical protein
MGVGCVVYTIQHFLPAVGVYQSSGLYLLGGRRIRVERLGTFGRPKLGGVLGVTGAGYVLFWLGES